MRISIVGLGYVGCVSAACLASAGNRVIGVDVNAKKVDLISAGHSPIIEKGIDSLVSAVVDAGQLTASTDLNQAVLDTELTLVCVGTPSRSNGSLDLQYIKNSVSEIGRALKNKNEYHIVTIRSTMLPGTLENIVLPILESESGKKIGVDFGLCVNPEFLREGTAIDDYRNPPFSLIGAWDKRSAEPLRILYGELNKPVYEVDIKVAEMVKYSCNIFHALKVGFANEIGALCKEMDIDSHQVMDIFKQDRDLNISTSYLTPGFAFGGSCLPKDLRAVNQKAKELDLAIPILEAILPSNQAHIERTFDLVQQTGRKKIGIFGLSFKAGTDDLRESPIVQLAERLLGKGYEILIYDKNVELANLLGANKDFIEKVIPHLARLLTNSVDELLAHSDVLIISQRLDQLDIQPSQFSQRHQIIDLVRAFDGIDTESFQYHGICW